MDFRARIILTIFFSLFYARVLLFVIMLLINYQIYFLIHLTYAIVFAIFYDVRSLTFYLCCYSLIFYLTALFYHLLIINCPF